MIRASRPRTVGRRFLDLASPRAGQRRGSIAFQDYLDARGRRRGDPAWAAHPHLLLVARMRAEPFEAPPADKWQHIVTTLKFVRDEVIPRGRSRSRRCSGFRNDKLNACSNGAEHSAHREFFAIDLTPVNAAVIARDDQLGLRRACPRRPRLQRSASASTRRPLPRGLVELPQMGRNGQGATSPCVAKPSF